MYKLISHIDTDGYCSISVENNIGKKSILAEGLTDEEFTPIFEGVYMAIQAVNEFERSAKTGRVEKR